MPIIGVRELREHTADILRKVRQDQAEYIVTYQGKPIALLVPVREEEMEKAMLHAGRKGLGRPWDSYAALAEKIRSEWPPDRSSQEVLDGIRG